MQEKNVEKNYEIATEKKKIEKRKRTTSETSLTTANDDQLFFIDNKMKIIETTKPTLMSKKPEPIKLPGVSDFWNIDLATSTATQEMSSSDDDEDDKDNEQQQKKKRKLNAAEKFKQQQAEESRLREIEKKYADPNQLPETADQYDRLVISEPNNSKNWINYMAFHLQSAEMDKARAVARRAIKAINFRESEELLNIWVALLNLELRYGTQESYANTLQESLTFNEPMHVYLRVLDLLSASDNGQHQTEVLNIIGILTRKFKAKPEIWRAAANTYFRLGMADRAQQLLHKAIASLPEREHVNMIVAFANLNHKYGHNELSQTLLDQVVTSYPNRVDVWTQYVDLLAKENLIDSARSVLDRATSQKIPLKKMRTLFKKYLEFEERFGTQEDVAKVKNLAMEYVKRNTTL